METQLYTITIDRKEKIQGIVLNNGEEWVLIKSLYSDFMIDGFKFINKKFIKSMKREKEEEFIENVLKANNKWNVNFPEEIKLRTKDIFNWLFDYQQIFQISLKDETVVYVGRIEKLLNKSFYLKPLNPQGVWEDFKYLFRKESIRVIEIESDYIESLLCYNKSIEG